MNSPGTLTSAPSGAPMAPLVSDWQHTVYVATALVSDKWVLPETACHAATIVMGEELAPFLCAYGL